MKSWDVALYWRMKASQLCRKSNQIISNSHVSGFDWHHRRKMISVQTQLNSRQDWTWRITTYSISEKNEEPRDLVKYVVYKNNSCIPRINIEVTRHLNFLSNLAYGGILNNNADSLMKRKNHIIDCSWNMYKRWDVAPSDPILCFSSLLPLFFKSSPV